MFARKRKTELKMETKENLTAERSLEIIRESIERSQRTITRNSSWSFVWWGSCVVVFAFLIAYLWKQHGGPAWNALWAVMWIVGYLGERVIGRHREPVPTTFVGRTISQVWGTFGAFMGVMGFVLGLYGCGLLPAISLKPGIHEGYAYINITSIISLCFGIASTITGSVIRNRIVQVCGFIAGLGGFFLAMHYPWAEQLYVMAAVAVVGLIIPGLVIYYQNK